MKQITAILLGAGNRGAEVYAAYALKNPEELKITAAADPRLDRLQAVAAAHTIAPENCAQTWETLLQREKFADCVFVCTQDQMHYEPVMAALEKGYDVLCEKPMSGDPQELRNMARKARETGRILRICHVLHYSPFFLKIKELLDADAVGQLITVQHIESVGYWHMAHSFVRGNWRNTKASSPMILQKCCHDTDILSFLIGSRCKAVSSFGSLSHFCAENRPAGAPDYCLDGCPVKDSCPYYAPRFYLEHPKAKADGFDKIVSLDSSPEAILEKLRHGPYGRCVYACDNDVVDHQIVNMLYENGVTVSMTMSGFTQNCERIINLMGSRGQICANMEENRIDLFDFASNSRTSYPVEVPVGGHSGSDTAMMQQFLALLRGETVHIDADADSSAESHLIALAAEESRLQNGKVIEIQS